MQLFIHLLPLLLLLSNASFGEEGHGEKSGQSSSGFFDSVGKPQSDPSFRGLGKDKTCEYICDNNKERYVLNYYCNANEGKIKRDGVLPVLR